MALTVGAWRVDRLRRLDALPRRRAARMVSAPTAFDGTLEEFATRHVLPNLPPADAVERFHRLLAAYCRDPDPLFLARQVTRTERGRDYLTGAGDRFRATDNAPAWAVHYAVFHDVDLQPEIFPQFVDGLPTHIFETPRVMDAPINRFGWHVAHINPVKDGDTAFPAWDRPMLVWRFVRNIHPCNYFVVPLAQWQRHGGDGRVIAYFATLYAQRYAAIWPEFLDLAKARPMPDHRAFGDVRFAYGPAQGTRPARAASVAQGSQRFTEPAAETRPGEPPLVAYAHPRLCFRAEIIEPLPMDGSFQVRTRVGVFQMTKAQFYRDFANVVNSRSYRTPGGYHYPTLPQRAEHYRVH